MIIKPPCDRSGQPFLNGSSSTCQICLQDTQADGHRRRHRLKCDCGLRAAAVIYAKINIGDAVSLEPLAVCEQCLQIEMETQKEYL